MITKTDTDQLRGLRATHGAVISLYLNIPVDLADHRGLMTRARELIKAIGQAETEAAGLAVREPDVEAILAAVTGNSQDWLGQTVAFFACAELGLFEVIVLPGPCADRAVLASKPYLRPLLSSLQRNPAYQVAVLDTKHAWVLAVSDDEVDTVAQRTGQAVPSTAFAGWYGLEAYRIQQRVIQLSRQHYRDTIGMLEHTANSERRPLVLGGHQMQINQFLAMLPQAVRQRVAGSFAVDLQTATPARIRELAAPVIADWARAAEVRLVNDVLSEPPGTSVMTNLRDCVTAVRSRAVSQLVLADDRVVPGCACVDCGALGIGALGSGALGSEIEPGSFSCDCPDPAGSCLPVPDLLDELTGQALDGGSEVAAVRQAPFTAAARLRFQLAGS